MASDRAEPPGTRSSLPRTEREIAAAGAALGLAIPAACLPGVVLNMTLLARHAAVLRGEA